MRHPKFEVIESLYIVLCRYVMLGRVLALLHLGIVQLPLCIFV